MSDPLLVVIFLTGMAVSLGFSWVLVQRLERVGARVGLSEALLGMLAALAADSPEITAAVTALIGHNHAIGSGVVIGSNAFNLAALIGLSAVLAGRITLHRRVIELGGAVALLIALVCLAVVAGLLAPFAGLLLALAAMGPYIAILGMRHERLAQLRLPESWTRWLVAAVSEEESELEVAIHPSRGGPRDGVLAVLGVVMVVAASIAMERTGAELGRRHGVSEVIIGGLLLAAVTGLPNAVAGVYLAMRARGAAVLSTALNSNALNVLAGLLLPTTILGLGHTSGQTTFVAAFYLGLTAFALACAYLSKGLRRPIGVVMILAYLAFVGVLIASAS